MAPDRTQALRPSDYATVKAALAALPAAERAAMSTTPASGPVVDLRAQGR